MKEFARAQGRNSQLAAYRGLAGHFFELPSPFTFHKIRPNRASLVWPNFVYRYRTDALVGLVAVSPIALATEPPLVRLAGALDVSVSFFVYSRDGCYELSAV